MNIRRPDMEKIFRNIYLRRGWFNGSGSGSLPENTEIYRKFLQDFIRKNNVKTILDLGCGDWQSTRLMNWDGLGYTGVDVVSQVVEDVKKRYAKENIDFIYADITEEELPPADLVIIKDVLQHWPNEIIQKFLSKLTPYSHVLVTNTVEIHESGSAKQSTPTLRAVNRDITLGDGRPLDLAKAPFNVPCQELLRYPSTKRYQPIQDIKNVLLLKK